ncbi:methyltransferase domain-containing protein [Rhodobacteraceae bacterium B1Z28]|uniref:Methyltransferase domain-containing protein n=1 Tax=Ruegeria haliotis TaxID=2747601 RepID=A0ABX2PRD0_9RHOB|nr:methyltransferase domain-containing protein [Ruegeria haliotis]NVO56300.1 methyltransferase domain-containing protein [Ruegeria haliotis]
MTLQLTEKVQRSFSRSFDTYHDAASQQAWVANRLVTELRGHGAPSHFGAAFELGCGTGHLTRLLCKNFSFDRLSVNDIASQARDTADAAGANFVAGDARHVRWPRNVDLLTSASMIQWMDDPADFLAKAARGLAPGGWLAVSGFGPKQYQELTQIGSTARAPGLCGPEVLAAAVGAKLQVLAVGESLRKSHFATPRHVLEYLRKTGVNGRAKGAWTKSTLARFTADYIRYFETPKGVSLTYHPVWIIARKG